jgi:iron-sulfur cluster repair protein YtfE (RIC family)
MSNVRATDILKSDHRRVQDLFRSYEEAGDNAYATKRALFVDLRREIETHARVEEALFYPAVNEAGGLDAEPLVVQAIEEHELVKRLLDELARIDPTQVEHGAKMKVLRDNVESHMRLEERALFRHARRSLGARRLEELGAEMDALRRELGGPAEDAA